MAFLIAFTASRDVDWNEKFRWGVIVRFHGVRGARRVGRGGGGSRSSSRARPMLSTVPTGPRRLERHWLAAATSTGLRVALPTSRAVRAESRARRPGLRTRLKAALF